MGAHRFNRRHFIGYGLALPLFPAGSGTQGDTPLDPSGAKQTRGDPAAGDGVWQMITEPPLDCRPKTRWWWYGGAVTGEEIARELESMRAAGIGGAEIQPVYPVTVDQPEQGILHVPFFSSRWYDLLAFAVRRGHELGMEVDLTLGSGWPFGGPFIDLGQAARKIRFLTREFDGPARIQWNPRRNLGEGERLAALAGRRFDLPPDGSASRVFDAGEIEQLASGDLGIGPGRWRFFAAIDAPTYMEVKRPTLGMEGYVLDHFARPPLELFLEATGERTLRELAKRRTLAFDNVFCDSLEVFGADWTPALMEEFQKRRGYDLSNWIHLLAEGESEISARVWHDYHQTLSELTLENFFEPLADWCSQKGIPSRVQAHGAMGDIMRAYGTVDIPEGETIFGGDVNRVNLRHRRLASSAAHVYSKPVVSAETYTWLRMPMFLVNLEMMKAATDAAFLDGINQIVNHGYSYSPPQAGRPGWSFYASTHISPANTWWRHYHHLSAYVRRCAAVLRDGRSVNRVGIYIPLADIFSSRGIGGFHLDEAIEERLGAELVESLRKAGYDFDLLNDDVLVRLGRVESGKLAIGTGRYEAVILPAVQSIPIETLEVLASFNRAGGYLGFYQSLPERVPGLPDFEARQDRMREILAGIKARAGNSGTNGKGHWMTTADLSQLIRDLDEKVGPDLRILEVQEADPGGEIGFTRRQIDGKEVFFISNLGAGQKSVRVSFGVGHRRPRRFDPMALSREDELIYAFEQDQQTGRKTTRVNLELDPFEACFIEFSDHRRPLVVDGRLPRSISIGEDAESVFLSGWQPQEGDYSVLTGDGKTHRLPVPSSLEVRPVEGPWTLKTEKGHSLRLDRLESWTEIEALKGFSGWATYRTDFEAAPPDPDLRWMIDLGEVYDTAEVTLNGSYLGDAWKRPRVIECTSALREGKNRLEIRVANLFIHQVLASPPPDHSRLERSYGIRWGRYGEVPPESIPPAGLLGPVRLIPERRIRLRLAGGE